MLIWLRNVVYLLLVLVGLPWLLYRSLTTGRYRKSWKTKLFGIRSSARMQQHAPSSSRTIWLHGVSVGEVQLLRPLVEELHRLLPDALFSVSTTTETGMELAQKLFSANPAVSLFYFPLDFSWAIRRTLDEIAPSMIVLGELELWPNLIDMAAHRSIPIAVVNGRLSERSFAGYSKLRWLTRPMFEKLALVAAQDATYASRFLACGTPEDKVATTGSFKFDNVAFDRNSPEVATLRSLVGVSNQHRVWIVGSTQAPEEIVACKAFANTTKEFPELKLIVVPRHKERFDEVAKEIRATKLRVVCRSTLTQPISAEQWDVLLIDTIGELRWWWGVAELAIVGGSFGKRGGQNMLEAAAYGINVAFGPNTQNFRDIADLLLSAHGAERIAALENIEAWLLNQLRDPTPGQERGRSAQRLIEEQQGAIVRTAKQLVPLLKVADSGT
jgi:3-deoxy-D-manno-octulosonic-acid transferase